jgi:E3 ubiquitin-protein ligase BRE1
LNHERESLLKRVNDLLLAKSQSTDSKKVSEQDIRRSPLYTETATKLTTVTRQFDELQAKLKETLEKYAEVKADADLAKKTLEERLDEFQQRWAELTGGEGEENGNQAATGESPDVPSADPKGQSKRIIELEHKLKQALENVRQADTVRSSLEEAHQMNDFLQGKLEELKTKNAALVASKTAARSSSDLASLNDAPKDKEKPSTSHTPVSSEKAEKLAKEHRRMKKELAAAMQSKENAKEKQMVSLFGRIHLTAMTVQQRLTVPSSLTHQRAEKERDTLMKTNSRLLKQGIEKEDMNAKSLSTILHLKHLTEQLTTEKGLLEQQVKSAEQLALAARLATNAKERVTEELAKEKDVSVAVCFS